MAVIGGTEIVGSFGFSIAPLTSPHFTGVPTAPTAAPGTSTTQIATTAFVATSFAPLASPTFSGTVSIPILTVVTSETVPSIAINGGTAITGQTGTGGTVAMSASPAFTGTPTAPTATLGTNTTQIATTAFVLANAGGSASSITFSPLNLLSAGSDAIPAHTAAQYVVTTAGVDAMTLAAPTATTDDGKVIVVTSNTGNSHTITATGLFQSGVSAAVNLATFNAFAGATIILMAYQGKWNVLSLNGVVMS